MSQPITIREVTVRECRRQAQWRGRYTTGNMDPAWDVWLFVTISDGSEAGHGECIPTSIYYEPGHIGRSNMDEWAELLNIAQKLPGQDARRLDRLLPTFEGEDANSILDTLDFALHDLVGRRLGVPVAVLLGGMPAHAVHAIPVIHMDTPQTMAAQAAELHRKWGIIYFKLKPIGEPEADVEMLRRMREAMGRRVTYYMDANYALKVQEPDAVIAYMNRLHELGLEVYEDPIDTDFATYRYIRERTPVRLMLDEKARTCADVLKILQQRAADQINIHANWAGGFQAGLRKASLAALAGMQTMIGSSHYLGPGAAAYITLASVIGSAPCEQGFGEMFGRTSAVEKPYELCDGTWRIPDAPGLGVTPRMEMIQPLVVREETFRA